MTSITNRQLQRRLRATLRAYTRVKTALQTAQQQPCRCTTDLSHQAQTIFCTSENALLVEDHQLRVVLVTAAFCQLFALPLPPKQYEGQTRAQLLAQIAQTPTADLIARAMVRMTEARHTDMVRTPLPSGLLLQSRYRPVTHEGEVALHLWDFSDATQQQKTQEHLHELSRLAEQSPFPIIRYGRNGSPHYATPAAEPVLQALRQPEAQEFRQQFLTVLDQALSSGDTQSIEHPLNGKFYLWTVVPIVSEECANVYLTDISIRRQMEKELFHSQTFTKHINDTVPNLIFLYDLDEQRVTYCNQHIRQLLGYTEAEMLAMNREELTRLISPTDQPDLRPDSDANHNLADEQTFSMECRVQHRDGTWKWLRYVSAAFSWHPDGRLHQTISCALDITEERIAQEELRHSRLFSEQITNTVPNLIYIYDVASRHMVYCNKHVHNILGYTQDEIMHLDSFLLEKLFVGDDLPRFAKYWQDIQQAADGEVITLEVSTTHRNGTIRWLRINSSPFERDAQGQVTLVVGAAEDITKWRIADEQRRTANRRLAEQNHLFRQVIDTTPHLIYLKDDKGNYLLANRATADLYGVGTAEILRLDASKLPITPADAARYATQDQYIITSGQEVIREETFTRPNGEIYWYYSIKRPFELADGTIQVLGIDSNITELKRTQLSLRAAKEAAEETAREKQAFLANMSHEIRTPMNGVLGLASLLAKTSLDEQQRHYLKNIQHSADNLLVIINDILVTAQLGAGKIRPEIVSFDLLDVLRTSYQALLPQASEKGIRLELDVPAVAAVQVLGDPYRLRQVLLNLLGNAVKFTDRGQVLLTCRAMDKDPADSWFEFSVVDTGIGIPAQHLDKVFETFTQASSSTAREYGGSGLGLSISRGLVELLGGTLTVTSTLGQGSTFQFCLPLPLTAAEHQPEAPAPPARPDFKSLGARRILLAEDNSVNQLLAQTILQQWGMQVDTAFTGPEALALFRQHAYDVVLMDIQMPGMDGITTTRLLREHPDPARAATPVIALTAHAMRGEAERYRAAGLNGYVSKPFREEELFRAIAEVLQQALPVVAATTSPSLPFRRPRRCMI